MKRTLLAGAAIAAAVWSATPCLADQVIDWNNVMLDAVRATRTNPPRATRIFAMVHTAVFDAVNGIEREYQPYFVTKQPAPGASADAAAATAAYVVLSEVYPNLRLELRGIYVNAMKSIPNGAARARGKAYGEFCARQIIKLRKNDNSDLHVPYEPSGEIGRWQPTPPAYAPALLPNWPYVLPFAMVSGDQFRAPPTPPLESDDYAIAYNEVREYGDVDSDVRTEDQTIIAYFWEDGGGSCTPPGHWLIIAQQLSDEFGLSLLENARLFALMSIVQADGAICAWDNKYYYDHVRPYSAITLEGDIDGNPDTHADPDWFNLIPTPPFPAYTSGHSTFSGGSSKMLELFLGTDDIEFSGESPDPQRWPDILPGVVRSWTSLSQAAEEAGQSRIYGGIHWQYDNQEGLNGGRAIAEYVYENFLLPR